MNDSNLIETVRRLDDIEAIRKLTAKYALYINKGWNGEKVDLDKLPSVFSENASWTCKAMNVDVAGRADIVAMLKQQTDLLDFAMHSFSNPIIDVTGDTATGNWLLWVSVKKDDAANEVFQSEDLEYVRAADGWRISSINLHFATMLLK